MITAYAHIFPVYSLHTLNLHKIKISSQKISVTKKRFYEIEGIIVIIEVPVMFGSNKLIDISVSII